MPKLLIFLAVWRRPEITEICFMGIDRLRKSGLAPIEAFAVISEDSMKPLCKKYSIDYVMHKNEPLGEKKNVGLQAAMQKEFDYMIEIGSDDLLKTEFFKLYPFERDVYGLQDFIMLDSETGNCRRLKHRDGAFGVGRAISRGAIETAAPLWHPRQTCGLDNYSEMHRLSPGGFLMKRIASDEPVVIDIKSADNLWPFDKNVGVDYDFDKTIEGLSELEKTAIKCLVTKNKSAGLIDA